MSYSALRTTQEEAHVAGQHGVQNSSRLVLHDDIFAAGEIWNGIESPDYLSVLRQLLGERRYYGDVLSKHILTS